MHEHEQDTTDVLIFKSFGSDRKGVGKASPQYQKDSMSF